MVQLMLLTMAVTGMSFASFGNEVFAEEAEVAERTKDVTAKEQTHSYTMLIKMVVTYDQAGVILYYANPYGVMERNG